MRRFRMSAPVGWMATGLGCMSLGVALALSASIEIGMAIVLLGSAAVGFALGLTRSQAADRALVAEVERQIDEKRARDLREVEERWRAEGVSPLEQSYRAFLRPGATETDAPLRELDARLGELIQARCERVWQGIRERRYVYEKNGRIVGLDGGTIFAELRDVVKEVARLYKRDGDRAELEVRIGDVALSARSVIAELLQAVRQTPIVDIAGWTVAEVVTALERVQKARHLYQKVTPWKHYVSGLTLGLRIVLGASPVTLAAWTIGQEAATRIGGHVLKTYGEVWLKELFEGSVALVYLRVARMYDPQQTYRSADWLALVDALRIHRRVPGIDQNRRLLLDCILRAQIPDEFAKLALLRALADDAEPDLTLTPPVDLTSLAPARRRAVADCLAAILQNMQGLNEKQASEEIAAIEKRLSISLPRDEWSRASRAEVRVEAGLVRLAELARDRCRLDIEEARDALAGSAFAAAATKQLGGVDAHRARLDKALTMVFDGGDRGGVSFATGERYLVDPLRVLVGDPLAEPLAASIADLMASRGPTGWQVDHDHLVLDNASVLLPDRKRVETLWSKYLKAVESRLRGRLLHGKLSTVPPVSAPTVLRQIGSQELPARDDRTPAPVPPPAPRPVAVFEAEDGGARARWVLLFIDRVVVGVVPRQELAIDVAEPRTYRKEDVRFGRRSGYVTDSLVLHCGEQRLTIEGPVMGSFIGHFGPVLQALDLDAGALEVIDP